MKTIFHILFFFLSITNCFCQWSGLNAGISGDARVLYYDSLSNKIIVGGYFTTRDSVAAKGIATWDGTTWDSEGTGAQFGTPVYSIGKYLGTLYASSIFSPDWHLDSWWWWWNGQLWDTLAEKVNGVVAVQKEHNGEYYLGGSFDSIGSSRANMLAKFDGVNYTSLSVPSPAGGFAVQDIEFYNGQMYIGGNFYDSLTNVNDLERFNGVSYEPFGGIGLSSGAAYVSSLEVFHNELYIAGWFKQAWGDPENFIMRWDGTQFRDVGNGLDGPVYRMHVYNDELYVCGSFTQAGNLSVTNAAKWDGISWNQITPGFRNNGPILDILVAQNNLYIGGGFDSIQNIQVYNIAVYYNLQNINLELTTSPISLFPNPAGKRISIQFNQIPDVECRIWITNLYGETVDTRLIEKGHSSTIHVDISSFPPSVYSMNIQSQKFLYSKKFIKCE